jgi:hypothetical protein
MKPTPALMVKGIPRIQIAKMPPVMASGCRYNQQHLSHAAEREEDQHKDER